MRGLRAVVDGRGLLELRSLDHSTQRVECPIEPLLTASVLLMVGVGRQVADELIEIIGVLTFRMLVLGMAFQFPIVIRCATGIEARVWLTDVAVCAATTPSS